MNDNQKNVTYLSNEETADVSRKMLSWINQYPDKPVKRIDYEYLYSDVPCMALSTIQGAYKIRQYITGGYQAQYQFKIIYRLQPSNNDDRLTADEVLNTLGAWAAQPENKPDIGAGKRVVRVTCNSLSSVFGAYANGDEDHQILMTMTYEVI